MEEAEEVQAVLSVEAVPFCTGFCVSCLAVMVGVQSSSSLSLSIQVLDRPLRLTLGATIVHAPKLVFSV